ncbi:type II toxin-antitoxin system HigB family toxin [Methylobacterium sp. E-045]|uniref:type II toxin-antitoxin system HigB family toxin n=1 Tax=Methylobacterium sp. E-045 TaxID=2836575 RepID=UPI001FBB8A97|nr:type II toxin-antitoxin system HigB family toxin [Methylobacterium sp. E-045]MCJ2128874.1 type II toxin-antitoxin system HigB family toxin [Methylobacterium sp. E-045]
MRVISNKSLVAFAATHASASAPLQAWRKIVETNGFANFSELKKTFNTVDRARGYYVFDVGGNKYRLIAAIHFDTQKLFVRHVFTHKEYDAWNL